MWEGIGGKCIWKIVFAMRRRWAGEGTKSSSDFLFWLPQAIFSLQWAAFNNLLMAPCYIGWRGGFTFIIHTMKIMVWMLHSMYGENWEDLRYYDEDFKCMWTNHNTCIMYGVCMRKMIIMMQVCMERAGRMRGEDRLHEWTPLQTQLPPRWD